MKTKINFCIAFAILVSIFSSCSTIHPLNATSNPLGNKVGSSEATSVFGICFDGDASIRTAAKNGGITKISTVDVKKTNVLFVVTTVRTIVTGE
jgi:hypothetical protein